MSQRMVANRCEARSNAPTLILAVVVFLSAVRIDACSCGRWPTVPEALLGATSVFEGVVVAKSPALGSQYGFWFVFERWTFAVERSWKGASSQVVVSEGYSNCSKVYSLGQKAVVYAYRHESRPGELETSKCGEPRGDTSEQLNTLGAPRRVFSLSPVRPESSARRNLRHFKVYALVALASAQNSIVSARESPSSPPGLVVIAVAVVFLIQLSGLVFLRRQRRKFASVLAVTVLLLVGSSFVIASRQVRGGYLSHLIEYECSSCPGGY